MGTCLEVVTRSLRFMGVISAGQVASGQKASDGMEALRSLILNQPGLIQNGRFVEVATSADYEADEGERVTCTGAVTVTLPTTVSSNGCTRPPLDLARVYVIGATATVDFGGDEDGDPGLYIFSATRGSWACVNDLEQGDEQPFGVEDELGLAAMLAVHTVGDYGAEISAMTQSLAGACAKNLRARFYKAAPCDPTRPSLCYDERSTDYY